MSSVLSKLASFTATAILWVITATLVENVTRRPQFAKSQLRAQALEEPSEPVRGALWKSAFVLLALVVALAAAAASIYDRGRREREANAATGGVGSKAIAVMTHNGCAGCHTIPGVPGARGTVGPRLDGSLSRRSFIAGTIPNSPANMVHWLQASREINERTAMPSTGITDQEARDVAAYLYALR